MLRHYKQIIADLSRDADERYLEFVRAKPETLVYRNLIFDLERLDCYFNCEKCRTNQPQAFCCRHELELTGRDLAVIEQVLPEVGRAYPRLSKSATGGFWTWNREFERVMRRKAKGDCFFLMPSGRGCYLHAWALSRGLDPLEVKPYICGLYPLMVLIVGAEVVVTTLNRESERVLDCGGQARPCTKKRGRAKEHLVLKSEGILTRMFGARAYQALVRALAEKRGEACLP